MRKVAKQIRQGDVLITPAAIPEDAKKEPHIKRLVLAEGEVTGHAHVVKASKKQVERFTHENQTYLKVNYPVTLTHEEHGPIVLEPGTYEVRQQIEVWMDEVRQVAD